VTPEPVGELLGPRGRRVGGVARAEDADEERDREEGAGGGIHEGGLLPGVVDERLLSSPVRLAQAEAVV
jgi:hypothetical protein